jgi:hypothetical protein
MLISDMKKFACTVKHWKKNVRKCTVQLMKCKVQFFSHEDYNFILSSVYMFPRTMYYWVLSLSFYCFLYTTHSKMPYTVFHPLNYQYHLIWIVIGNNIYLGHKYIIFVLSFPNRRVRTLYACLGENDGELSFEPNQIITNGKFS